MYRVIADGSLAGGAVRGLVDGIGDFGLIEGMGEDVNGEIGKA